MADHPRAAAGDLARDGNKVPSTEDMHLEVFTEAVVNMKAPGARVRVIVTSSGDFCVDVDGRELGVLMSGLPVDEPLWAIVDVYGQCTSLTFVEGTSFDEDEGAGARCKGFMN